jgi:hypothetical protein
MGKARESIFLKFERQSMAENTRMEREAAV